MFSLKRTGYYIRHIVSAKSRHGTHSPFVYRLLEEVVYTRKPYFNGGSKAERLTIALITNRKPNSLLLVGDFSMSFVSTVSEQFPDLHCQQQADAVLLPNASFDMVFCQGQAAWGDEVWTSLVHEDSVIVLSPLYRHSYSMRFWERFISWPPATVTIDMYHTGLVFFHGGQAKEHFRIRWMGA